MIPKYNIGDTIYANNILNEHIVLGYCYDDENIFYLVKDKLDHGFVYNEEVRASWGESIYSDYTIDFKALVIGAKYHWVLEYEVVDLVLEAEERMKEEIGLTGNKLLSF